MAGPTVKQTYANGVQDAKIDALSESIGRLEKRIEVHLNGLYGRMLEIEKIVAGLQVKSTVWGALGGLVSLLSAITIGVIIWIVRG